MTRWRVGDRRREAAGACVEGTKRPPSQPRRDPGTREDLPRLFPDVHEAAQRGPIGQVSTVRDVGLARIVTRQVRRLEGGEASHRFAREVNEPPDDPRAYGRDQIAGVGRIQGDVPALVRWATQSQRNVGAVREQL